MAHGRMPAVAVVALLIALQGCNCGKEPGLLAIYTDLTYTNDGRTLVLEATDGLYAAQPPTATPVRLSEMHCGFSKTKSLDCVQIASDGRRAAALINATAKDAPGTAALHLLTLPTGAGGEGVSDQVIAQGVYGAAFSQDGAELVWGIPGEKSGTMALWRLGPAGGEAFIPEIALTQSEASAMKVVAVTPAGVAYPVASPDAAQLWFKPFDGRPQQAGRLDLSCRGANFARCVVASSDGATLAWQDKDSGVLHVFRTERQVDLPLGQGYGLSLTRSGNLALRMDVSPDSANVQKLDTALRLRYVANAISGELSADGELLAYQTVDSEALKTSRLFVGSSRTDSQDHDYGVFTQTSLRPLLAGSVGNGAIEHSFTGDGRFVILAAKGPASTSADLISVNVETAEQTLLARYGCSGCCGVSAGGALLVCLPTVSNGSASGPAPVYIYDPFTGLQTQAASKAIDLQYIFDGSGVAVLDYTGEYPEAVVAYKDGRVTNFGKSLRLALSPATAQIALLTATGGLSVQRLP